MLHSTSAMAEVPGVLEKGAAPYVVAQPVAETVDAPLSEIVPAMTSLQWAPVEEALPVKLIFPFG
jgi:hypothetical protein